jgi:hypothetical protein
VTGVSEADGPEVGTPLPDPVAFVEADRIMPVPGDDPLPHALGQEQETPLTEGQDGELAQGGGVFHRDGQAPFRV